MRQIRRNVFETNSSSTHSICIVTKDEFDWFTDGNLVYDRYNEELIPYENAFKSENKENTEFDYFCKENELERNEESFRDYINYEYSEYLSYEGLTNMDYEYYSQSYTTPKGESIVAFGYYGMD